MIVSTSYSASRETSNDYDDQDILGGLEDQHTQVSNNKNPPTLMKEKC